MENNKETNFARGCGIASLVFSILSIVLLRFIVLSIIFAIVAIVFGIISSRQKDGLGKAGLIIGIISILITIILYLLLDVFDISSLFMVPSWYK